MILLAALAILTLRIVLGMAMLPSSVIGVIVVVASAILISALLYQSIRPRERT